MSLISVVFFGMAFRIITYNPLTILSPGRSVLIEQQLAKIDVVIMPGTRVKMNTLIGTPWSTCETEKSAIIDWGYARGAPFANRACGVRIMMRKDRHKLAHIRQIWSPPPAVQGRGGALRLKSSTHDFTVLAIYFPVRANLASEQKRYRDAVSIMLKWMDTVLLQVRTSARRSIVIIAGDLNDELKCNDEKYTASKFRALCTKYDMMIPTEKYKAGPTYFGHNGSSSSIDVIAIAEERAVGIASCIVHQHHGKRLHAINTALPMDHYPVQLTVKWHYAAPARTFKTRIDRAALVREVMVGEQRVAVISHLEGRMSEVLGKYQEHEFGTADGIWQDIVAALKDTMEKFFSGSLTKQDTAYQDKQNERRKLAKQYADIKGRIEPDDDMDEIREQLKEISRTTSRLQKVWRAKKRDTLMQLLWNEYRHKPNGIAFKICRQLAETQTGKSKIYYNRPPAARPSTREWAEYLAKPGAAGGMNANTIDFDTEALAIIDSQAQHKAKVNLEATLKAEKDYEAVKKVLRKSKLHKASSPWDVPAEMWQIAVFPACTVEKPKISLDTFDDAARAPPARGRHAAIQASAPNTDKAVILLLAAIRRTMWCPTDWHRSKACPIDKRNGKPGCPGLRLIHVLAVFGRAWFQTTFDNKQQWPPMEHGALPHRH